MSQSIDVEGASLAVVRKRARSQVPAGLTIIREEVLTDGIDRELGTGETVEEAIKEARGELPNGARVLKTEIESEPEFETLEIEGGYRNAIMDEYPVREKLEKSMSHRKTLHSLSLKSRARKGFLGIGKKPNVFEAKILHNAVVWLTYTTGAKIRFHVGTREEKIEWVLQRLCEPKDGSDVEPDEVVGELVREFSFDATLPFLEKYLFSTSVNAKAHSAVATALAKSGSKTAASLLEKCLFSTSVNAQVHSAVATALAKSGSKMATSLLERALHTKYCATMPIEVARALGCVRRDSLLPLLLSGLRSPDDGVRFECARLAERLGDPGAIEPLWSIANDQQREPVDVRLAAAIALAKLAPLRSLMVLARLVDVTRKHGIWGDGVGLLEGLVVYQKQVKHLSNDDLRFLSMMKDEVSIGKGWEKDAMDEFHEYYYECGRRSFSDVRAVAQEELEQRASRDSMNKINP
jgi:HEAT repeat protein